MKWDEKTEALIDEILLKRTRGEKLSTYDHRVLAYTVNMPACHHRHNAQVVSGYFQKKEEE